MSIQEIPNIICILPREILENIFEFLPVIDLCKCREVCVQWNEIIKSDEFWRDLCKRDFNNIYKEAKFKAHSSLSWQRLYKSLKAWSKLNYTKESRTVLISSKDEEFKNLKVVKNGIVAVHVTGSVKYYDPATQVETDSFAGNNKKYDENEHFIIQLQCMQHPTPENCANFYIRGAKRCTNKNCFLKITQQISRRENVTNKPVIQIENVTDFLLDNKKVYFIRSLKEINVYTIKDGISLLNKFDVDIIAMSLSDGRLNILTKDYTMLRQNSVSSFDTIAENSNILNLLNTYNFFERFDEDLWCAYYNWVKVPKSHSPQGPLTRINTIKAYGDVILLGTTYGILNIYYAPYTNGVLDLVSHKAAKMFDLKQYQLMCDGTFSACLRAIDVIETENGHKVVVCLNWKVIILDLVESNKKIDTMRWVPVEGSDEEEEIIRRYIVSDPRLRACFPVKPVVD